MRQSRSMLLFVALLFVVTLACGIGGEGPPGDAVVIDVVANSSLNPWLEEAVAAFNEQELETGAGDPVWVMLTATDAGQAVLDFQEVPAPDLWIPDSQVWANVLAKEGVAGFQGQCTSVAESPLVIAMWQPLAESLGWPSRDLGWLDIGSLAADPGAWTYYSGGRFGDVLRLGHTHPGLSGTGASTLLALVQAAESQQAAVGVDAIQQPIVQASVGAFEGAVSWFSSSTGDLARTMRERGTGFLGAAVMYESDVIQYGQGDPALIPVYPFEGTFVADHPACINGDAPAATREAATIFRDYLRSEEGQQLALAAGLRPVNDAVPAGPPLDESNGVDLEQPRLVFAAPTADTLFAVQELWQSARKDVNMVMLLDVSGSMSGSKIDSMRRAAVQFVEQMGDEDYLTIIPFSYEPVSLVKYQQVGENREEIIQAIRALEAEGDTALYDAIGEGATLLENTTRSDTTNALVVLTDGLDTYSYVYNQDSALSAAARSGATVFTIAYGSDADEELLENLAFRANGNYFRGDEASIAAIYDEMSAAFGGSVGVGR